MQGWSRIVTTEGELLTPGGALKGASLQGRGEHLVGAAGIGARTPLMAAVFVTFGARQVAAALALWLGRLRYAVVTLAVATLWYAVFGTVVSIVIGFLASRAPRENSVASEL